MEKIDLKKLSLGPYGTNAYLLICNSSREALLIDPAAEPEKILQACRELNISKILMTHNHFDHFQALSSVKKTLNVTVGIHPKDASQLTPPPDFPLNDGDIITFGRNSLKVLHTPGHTPGSVVFYTDGIMIAGDTLFPGGPGKTGTPGAFKEIIKSITDKLFSLPEQTGVYPGHGENTTLTKAREEYEIFNQRQHSDNLCGDVLWLSS